MSNSFGQGDRKTIGWVIPNIPINKNNEFPQNCPSYKKGFNGNGNGSCSNGLECTAKNGYRPEFCSHKSNSNYEPPPSGIEFYLSLTQNLLTPLY